MNDKLVNLKPFLDILREAELEREYFEEVEALERERDEQDDAWERHLDAIGGDRDGPPDPDNGFVSQLDREVNRLMVEFDELVERQVRDQEDAISALVDIRRALELQPSSQQPVQQTPGKVLRDPHPDEPLSLFEAVCLPELGGKLYDGDEGSVGKFSAKTLRAEIAAGRLKRVPPLNKNIYVSRKTIKEWAETEWQDQESHRTSFGSSLSTTKPQANSGRMDTGRSRTEPPELAQASALSNVMRLKQRVLNTK